MIFFINRKRPAINKKTLRRVYLYHRGDISSLQNELQQFQEHFSASDPLQNSTEHNWQLLKDTMQKAISKHIPSKPARSCDKLPWITPLIKQKMKLRSVCMTRLGEQIPTQTGVTTRRLEMRSTAYLKLLTVTTVPICSMTLHQARKDFGHISKERITTELHHSRMEILFVLMLNTRHVF